MEITVKIDGKANPNHNHYPNVNPNATPEVTTTVNPRL